MKKFSVITLVSIAIAAFGYSCKHQPIDPALSTGGGNATTSGSVSSTCSADTVYFQQKVLPVFISTCAMSGCHDAISKEGGVNMTSYSTIMTTGDVRPFNPNSSKVWKKIMETNPSDRMPPPPQNPLTKEQKDIVTKWIQQGAANNSCVSSACDSTNIKFSGAIRNIINDKCLGCHSGTIPQGNISFTSYAGVKAKVDDGRLWGSINYLPGFSAMPKGGVKLSDCEIKQFKKWIDAGAPNN